MSAEKTKPNQLRWIDLLSKIAIPITIPITVALLAWFQNDTILKVQTSQNEANMELQLVNIVWQSLTKGNEREKERALNLIETFQPSLTFKLAEVISLDIGQSEIIRNQAAKIAKEAAIQILKVYKVDVYYDKNSTKDKNIATRIKSVLEAGNIVRKIVLVPRDTSFLDSVGKPSGYEIRYEPLREVEAASALFSVLKKTYPSLEFEKQLVGNRTENTLSIFIF